MSKRTFVAALLIAVTTIVWPKPGLAQTPAPAKGRLAVTVNDPSGAVVPTARVTVTGTDDATRNVSMPVMLTGVNDGLAVFEDLPPGRYTVTARLPPYLLAAYGARRIAGPGTNQTGTAVVLSSGQAVTGLSITLMRSAVITGTIRDVDGTPARGSYVTVWYSRRSPTGGSSPRAGR